MSRTEQNYQDLLAKIRTKDPIVTKEIYQDAFPKCARYILDNNGDYEHAQDIFQEAFVVLFEKSQQETFTLTAAPSTYLYSVAQKMWLMYLRTKKRRGGQPVDIVEIAERFMYDEEDGVQQKQELEEKINAIAKVFDQLEEKCKEMLGSYYYKKIPLKEIAVKMGYNYNFAKVKKNRCMNYLRKLATQLKQ